MFWFLDIRELTKILPLCAIPSGQPYKRWTIKLWCSRRRWKIKIQRIFDFTYDSSVKLSVDTSKDAKNLLKTKNITTNVTALSSGKILYNVGTEQVVDNRSCGPVAAYNLLYFWAHNGYPKLITGNADNDIAQLAKDM